MTPKLYTVEASPAVRSVLLLINAKDIEIELKHIDLTVGDHLTPEFLKLNPQHTVPTLTDGDFAIWDSHAINIYLLEKYVADDSLYPKDPKKRAVVNQRLHFDSGILFPNLANALRPIIRGGSKTISKENSDNVLQGYEFLEKFLEGHNYLAGDFVSIADFSAVTSVTTVALLIPVDGEKFPNVQAWLKRLKALPYYEKANQTGLDILDVLLKKRLAE